MDKESIFRLGLDYVKNIDIENSDEFFNPGTSNHTITLKLLKENNIICPYCGQTNTSKLRSTVTQIIKHASAIECNIAIKLKRRVYICNCSHTFKETNPFTTTKSKTTIQKEMKILESLKDINKSFTSIANEFNISVTSVQRIFDRMVDIKRQPFTTVLCVDEVYSKHCGFKKYCFITYSPQLNKILDVLPSRNKEDLCAYFGKIPIKERNSVKFFSMDLYEPYRQVAKLCFPNALICADHFHVIKNLNDCFNTARIRIMKKYAYLKDQNDNWYWLYKKYWKLLLKSNEKLGYTKFRITRSGMYLCEHEIVDYMLSIDKDLNNAYEILNEYRAFNIVSTIADAENDFDELLIKFHNSTLTEFYKAYKMLKNWRREIINSFHKVNGYIISNGGLERANRDVKTIVRHAYGFKNFYRLRNRIMYIKNKDASILNNKK